MSEDRVEVLLTEDDLRQQLARDARTGLTRSPKEMRTRWVWDARASAVYARILELDSYDLPRRERSILAERAAELASLVRVEVAVELGSGSSDRTPLVLEALAGTGLRRFVAVDVSEAALREAVPRLAARFPALDVRGAVADFEHQLQRVAVPGPRLVLFLGSTIGGLEPTERLALLREVATFVRPGGAFVVGVDLVKPVERILAAYAHADGLGDELSSNLLPILNRELGADFRLDRFDVVRAWNPEAERLETFVRSLEEQVVELQAIGLAVSFAEGETLRTQISTKFRRRQVEDELDAAGLRLAAWWPDADNAFAVCLARVA